MITQGRLSLLPTEVGLRTLDAIHVATALSLGEDVASLVTYDGLIAQAAATAGIQVVAPGTG